MSMKRPWYKRYPDMFIAGTVGMSNELMGNYALLIDLIYGSGGKLPYDPKRIAYILKLHTPRLIRIVDELCAAQKIHRSSDQVGDQMVIYLELRTNLQGTSRSQPIEKVRSGSQNPVTQNKSKNKTESISSSLSYSKSAGARAGVMEAPATPAPPEQKQADKTRQLTEEERAAFVRKILGREVRPGRSTRPELHRLLEED
jgi:uncharacterized protein YdaU (DUF1376 family)